MSEIHDDLINILTTDQLISVMLTFYHNEPLTQKCYLSVATTVATKTNYSNPNHPHRRGKQKHPAYKWVRDHLESKIKP